MIEQAQIQKILELQDGKLFRWEGQELEFKEQFNLASLADYFRDFSAFANNRGGYLIFGIKDKPRTLIGMSDKSIEQFNNIDPEKITGYLLELFSSEIRWASAIIKLNGMAFGVFRVQPANVKPVIARKDEGKNQVIKNGEIYYRYGGRTQKIQSTELESIIEKRIELNNNQWMDLVTKIGRAGPENAAILDTEKALIEKNEKRILVMEEGLASKLKFIKEGEFVEKKGAIALKLVGDIVPIEQIEVVKHVKEHLTKSYPFSATELAEAVKKAIQNVNRNAIWDCIKENNLKNNTGYSAYNFRCKKHEDEYDKNGIVPNGTPSIYNNAAVQFVINFLKKGEVQTS